MFQSEHYSPNKQPEHCLDANEGTHNIQVVFSIEPVTSLPPAHDPVFETYLPVRTREDAVPYTVL